MTEQSSENRRDTNTRLRLWFSSPIEQANCIVMFTNSNGEIKFRPSTRQQPTCTYQTPINPFLLLRHQQVRDMCSTDLSQRSERSRLYCRFRFAADIWLGSDCTSWMRGCHSLVSERFFRSPFIDRGLAFDREGFTLMFITHLFSGLCP